MNGLFQGQCSGTEGVDLTVALEKLTKVVVYFYSPEWRKGVSSAALDVPIYLHNTQYTIHTRTHTHKYRIKDDEMTGA